MLIMVAAGAGQVPEARTAEGREADEGRVS